ncbi:hypothetical protein HDU93_004387, partial [Gonapodya sp. JEL0774]
MGVFPAPATPASPDDAKHLFFPQPAESFTRPASQKPLAIPSRHSEASQYVAAPVARRMAKTAPYRQFMGNIEKVLLRETRDVIVTPHSDHAEEGNSVGSADIAGAEYWDGHPSSAPSNPSRLRYSPEGMDVDALLALDVGDFVESSMLDGFEDSGFQP